MLSKKSLKILISSYGCHVSDSLDGKALVVERPFSLGSSRSRLIGVDHITVRTLAEAKRALGR